MVRFKIMFYLLQDGCSWACVLAKILDNARPMCLKCSLHLSPPECEVFLPSASHQLIFHGRHLQYSHALGRFLRSQPRETSGSHLAVGRIELEALGARSVSTCSGSSSWSTTTRACGPEATQKRATRIITAQNPMGPCSYMVYTWALK